MQQIATLSTLTECRRRTRFLVLQAHKGVNSGLAAWPYEASRYLLLNNDSLPYVGPAALVSV